MRQLLFASLVLLVTAACDGPIAPDGSVDPDAGPDGSTTLCASDSHCGDQSLFCSRWRCQPGMAGTDARGCIDIGSTCEAGQDCNEDTDMCGAPEWCTEGRDGCALPGDCDGDNSRNELECGGDDCDDADGNRFPDNAEVCDASHDEDCDPTTFGTTDADSDGFVSNACCNGPDCGPDCDDADGNVNPGVAEVCDGIDNDCDGAIDASDSPLCPGGVCSAGRCELDGWDRAFGGGRGDDQAFAVAMDSAGNAYATGTYHASALFGSIDPLTSVGDTLDTFVVSYEADGRFRWNVSFGGSGVDMGQAIVVSGTTVIVAGTYTNPVDFGGGTRPDPGTVNTFVVALDASDGSYLWDVTFAGEVTAAAVDGAEVVIGGWFATATDFGGGAVSAPVSEDGFLSRYAVSNGAFASVDFIAGSGAQRVLAVDASSDGLLVGGRFEQTVNFGGGNETSAGATDAFVVAYAPDGSYAWHWTAGGTGADATWAVSWAPSGSVFAGGTFTGTVSFGGPSRTATEREDAWLLHLDDTGARVFDFVFGGPLRDVVDSVAVTSTGDVTFTGTFTGTVNFGAGPQTAVGDGDAFITVFSSTGSYVSGRRWGSTDTTRGFAIEVGPADSTAVVGSFVGSADFGTGIKTSSGNRDGYIVRLPN